MNPGQYTKAVYTWDTEQYASKKWRPQTLKWLQARANQMTDIFRFRQATIVFGKGMVKDRFHLPRSFEQGGVITLVKQQRDELTLIHELAHHLTPRAKICHGPAFLKMYAKLLWRFTELEGFEIQPLYEIARRRK